MRPILKSIVTEGADGTAALRMIFVYDFSLEDPMRALNN